jgi:hypothetical protein
MAGAIVQAAMAAPSSAERGIHVFLMDIRGLLLLNASRSILREPNPYVLFRSWRDLSDLAAKSQAHGREHRVKLSLLAQCFAYLCRLRSRQAQNPRAQA